MYVFFKKRRMCHIALCRYYNLNVGDEYFAYSYAYFALFVPCTVHDVIDKVHK